MTRVVLFGRAGCHLCDEAREVVRAVCDETGARLVGGRHRRPTRVQGRDLVDELGRAGPGGRGRRRAAGLLADRRRASAANPYRGGSSTSSLTGRPGRPGGGASRGSWWTRSGRDLERTPGRGSRVRRGAPARVTCPPATVARLPGYLQALRALTADRVVTTSSEELATRRGRHPGAAAQGPVVPGLLRPARRRVRRACTSPSRSRVVLGLTTQRRVVIVGIGNLGHALASYSVFAERGFAVVGLVDADPAVVGTLGRRASWCSRPTELADVVERLRRDHRHHRDPGGRRAGRVRRARRGRRRRDPHVRAARAAGARARGPAGRRRRLGAADPRVPRPPPYRDRRLSPTNGRAPEGTRPSRRGRVSP